MREPPIQSESLAMSVCLVSGRLYGTSVVYSTVQYSTAGQKADTHVSERVPTLPTSRRENGCDHPEPADRPAGSTWAVPPHRVPNKVQRPPPLSGECVDGVVVAGCGCGRGAGGNGGG